MRKIELYTATNCSSQHAKILTDRSPRAASVGFGDLAGFGVVRQIGHNILEHLRTRPLLHAGELGRRIRRPFAIHYFR